MKSNLTPPPVIDQEFLQRILLKLLKIHSPTGYTDPIVREVCKELDELGVKYELTRRGAIRVNFPGENYSQGKALVSHLDTLGAMVKELKSNGRCRIVPVGSWSSRFAEGARVSLFTDDAIFRGSILPLKASGHTYNDEIDHQPVSWDHVELRLDEPVSNREELAELGVNVGDFIGVDSSVELLPNGFVNARHLDDKAGVAAMMAALKALIEPRRSLPTNCHFLFTISEEVGSGASAVLHGDVAEMVSIDNGTCAPGQSSSEKGVTIAMADSTGPFDYHLTHHLIHLCENFSIPYVRDIFRYYRCDSASAVEAGNDIRTALVAFGVDASHGYERTTMDALVSVAKLIVQYAQSYPIYHRQTSDLNSLNVFPKTRKVQVGHIIQEGQEPLIQTSPEEESEPESPVQKGTKGKQE